ncbi:lytic murein transglycosylase [Sulfitobacter sabulilitoris]|uniref:Lytic murein transglycosylase n=1 Tax=Sulfitobacter sabulilitoris TaxID=2562655 RepID=A0A5S3PEQ8_9RHOB|nr:lytic murein transglycosylase [Sulfitobacter sabulilitoris]TMM52534.1 lytic murein transglycosylase [Sulfitobacter sabulilitoris]
MQWISFGSVAVMAAILGTSTLAGSVERSVRPMIRPAGATVMPVMALAAVTAKASLRPKVRPAAPIKANTAPTPEKENEFAAWGTGFKARALAQGISARTLSAAFDGVRYDPSVIKRDRNQSEFTKTIWDYLDSAASDVRIANGKSALSTHAAKLTQIEARYGVEKEVVLAIWGLESAYGAFRGSNDVIQSLSTLAFDGRRGAFFEEQLIAALKILQSGDTAPRNMTGSWAGAMGHTQFIPTSYLQYAVDFTGDGRRDIWSDDPSDALASTAAYLAKFGWTKGQPWGVEVRLPSGFDYALADRKIEKMPNDWARLGVVDVNGVAVPARHGKASVLLPAGNKGAAFMIFDNFAVIERYNTADAYVIGVGHLSDRIKGGPAIRSGWPRDDRALTFDERQEMQRRLTAGGFDTKGIDGRIGPKTIDAVRDFQRAKGRVPDGYASLQLLNALR